MKFSLTILSIVVSMLLANESRAQAGAAATEISRLQLPNSPANFTADRLRDQVVNRAVPQFGLRNVNVGAVGNALGRANKPFSSIAKGPSVTPYLALDNPFTSPATSYYTQIRPQMEQQRINQQQERQNQVMQRQISQYSALQPYDPTGSDARAPTGHASVYMNYGGYYTTPAPAGARRR